MRCCSSFCWSSVVICACLVFFCKQMTAYEVRISDWSSDVCSSDLAGAVAEKIAGRADQLGARLVDQVGRMTLARDEAAEAFLHEIADVLPRRAAAQIEIGRAHV